jgi:uncharacterized FlaG/YvyC family protein
MNETDKPQLRNNPVFVIGVACLLALTIFGVSFTTYYNSETRRTIGQIQKNNELLVKKESKVLSPTNKELNDQTIKEIQNSITSTIDAQSDESDFSVDALTDSALGL